MEEGKLPEMPMGDRHEQFMSGANNPCRLVLEADVPATDPAYQLRYAGGRFVSRLSDLQAADLRGVDEVRRDAEREAVAPERDRRIRRD